MSEPTTRRLIDGGLTGRQEELRRRTAATGSMRGGDEATSELNAAWVFGEMSQRALPLTHRDSITMPQLGRVSQSVPSKHVE